MIVGLTGNRNATPDKIAEYAQENGYYLKGTERAGACLPKVLHILALRDVKLA